MLRILLLLLPLLLLQLPHRAHCQVVPEESYTLVIKTGRTGTSSKVAMSLVGLKGDSPQSSINFDSSSQLIPDMFTPGKVDLIEGKFRGTLGYIRTVKVSQDSYASGWEIISMVVYSDTTRVSSNETYVIREPQDINFNVDCGWNEWGPWWACSGSCETGGTRSRARDNKNPPKVNSGKDCVGDSIETESCQLVLKCPVNGSWSDWAQWGACSVSCAQGSRGRSRSCTNPAPDNGGMSCPGLADDTEVCTKSPCPINGQWGSWSPFSACNASCGPGTQSRVRLCDSPMPQFNGSGCLGDGIERKSCELTQCPIDGAWSSWSDYSACSLTCGKGRQWSRRNCSSPQPQHGGNNCSGNSTRDRVCLVTECPVDGLWGQWGAWEACSVTCGNGTTWRRRLCDSPEPQFGGSNCTGSFNESLPCHPVDCPINGGWSQWSVFTPCSSTCGGGHHNRSRLCDSPPPHAGGANCAGSDSEVRDCGTQPCPVNGGWGEWSQWGDCSFSCGGGNQLRSRLCDSPRPQNGGGACVGTASDGRGCNTDPCPIDGGWSAWSDWSSCSVSCGAGKSDRQRTCSNPTPKSGGRGCSGSGSDIRDCQPGSCPVHGGWSEWSDFSNCSASCGNGTRNRSRSCSSPAPQFGGRYCLPCTANLTYPEPENATAATVVQDYSSVEDNCSYRGNYYEVIDDLIVWVDDVQYINCSAEPCMSNLADKANSMVDEFLKGLNSTGTNKSDSESMKAAQEMVNKIANLLADQLKNAEVGKPVMINAKGVSVGVSKVNSSNMAGSEMKSGDKGGIVLGDAEDTGLEGQDANLKFSALDPKTFFPGADKKDQSVAVVSLNLAQGTEVIKPSNSSKVSLTLALPNQNQETSDSLLQPVGMSRGQRMVQKLVFEAANTAVKVSLELPSSDNYMMLFRVGVPANFSKQANVTATVFSNGTIQQQSDGSLTVRLNTDSTLAAARRRRRREAAALNKPLTLSVFIPGGQVAAGGAVFMSLELADNSTTAASGSNATTGDAATNLTLTVGVASITPRAWKVDDLGLGGWVDTDAEVAEESSIEKMVFKSNFFGSYSGKMFIAPNTINFATVFNNFAGKLAENFVTLLVLCLIIGIYVVISVWMWRLDRQEAANLRYEPLQDNDFDNDYTFIISVYTGDESGADTTSNVFINLAGTWGSSGKRQLSDGVRQNFGRGSVCNFAMTTRAPLGELRGLKIWHDNSGKRPGWFLEKILIEDLQTKKNYIFMCDQWLAENKFDSRTMRVLPEMKQDQRFQEMLLRYKAGGVVNKHVITTLFRKTGQSSYTRMQRTGVANSMFFLTMVCNAMWFGKGDDLDAEANFSIDLGPISVTWFQLYSGILSMAITYPCIFAAAEIFRRTKKWQRRWSEDEMESQKKEIRLPKGFLVIGWGLLLLAVGLSFFFTFLYSIEWGKEKANGWLKSFFLGILQLVVVTDPVFLLIVFVVAKKIFGQKESEENVFELDDLINDDLKQVLDGTEYAPADPTKMEEIRAERRNSQKMSQTFTDVVSYVVYMFLLIALAYDSRDQVSYRQNQNLKDQFLTAAPARFNDFGHVFDWLGDTIVPRLYRTTDYNGDPLTGDLKDAIDTCDCIKQGPFRLRQLRVSSRKCPVMWPFKAYPQSSWTCSSDYSPQVADKVVYRPLWLPDTNGWVQNASLQLRAKSQIKRLRPDEIVLQAFWYRGVDYLMSFPFEGTFTTYPGDGFAATLGLNNAEAKWIIDRLRATNWLDERTRALFLEGTVYNANTNLFTTIQILLEFPASGGILTYRNGIRTYRLYNYTGGKGIVLMAMQGLFVLICLYQIYRETRSLLTLRLRYFDDLWNKIEFVNITLCITIMIAYGIRIKITINSIELMMNNRGMYVAFDNVIEWVEATCVAMALSVFLTIFRVLKFLGFNRHIAIMLATVKQCARQLSSFGIAFVLIMAAFLSAGTILFSFTEASFASVLSSCRSLFTTALGIQGYMNIFANTQGKAASLIFFGGWSCLSVFFLVSVFVSILTDTYSIVVSDGLYSYDEEFVNHMWSKFMGTMASITAKKDELGEVLQKGVSAVKRRMVTEDDIEIQLNEARRQQSGSGTEASSGRAKDRVDINPGLKLKLAVVNRDRPETGESYVWTPKETGDEVLVDAGELSGVATEDAEQDWIPRFKSTALDQQQQRGLEDSGAFEFRFDPLGDSARSGLHLLAPTFSEPAPLQAEEAKKHKKKSKKDKRRGVGGDEAPGKLDSEI